MDHLKKQKEQYWKDKEDFEHEKKIWTSKFSERAENNKKKFEELIKQQKYINSSEINSNIKNSDSSNIIDIERQRNITKLKSEISDLKYEYTKKLSEYTKQKNILNQEKESFEKYKTETQNSIIYNKNQLDKITNNLIQKESENNNKNLFFLEKNLDIKYNDFESIKKLIEEQNQKNKKDEIGLYNAINEFQKCENEFNINEKKINEEYKKLSELKNNIENDKKIINDYKQIIRNIKNEIENKMINLENIEKNLILNEINKQFGNGGLIEDNIKKNYIKSFNKDNLNLKTELKENNIGEKFNAEQYLLGVKNRIEGNKIKMDKQYKIQFDNFKEQDYLKKSKDFLDKLKK